MMEDDYIQFQPETTRLTFTNIDHDNQVEIEIGDPDDFIGTMAFFYIDQSNAIDIIRHLNKVFGLELLTDIEV